MYQKFVCCNLSVQHAKIQKISHMIKNENQQGMPVGNFLLILIIYVLYMLSAAYYFLPRHIIYRSPLIGLFPWRLSHHDALSRSSLFRGC